MSITDASNATAAAPAADQPVAETAKNVEEKTAVEEPSKEVSTKKIINTQCCESRLWNW